MRLTPRRALLAALAVLAAAGCSITEDRLVFGPGPPVLGLADPGWTVEHPISGEESPLGACLGPDGEAWLVGTGGLVLHDDGRGWRREDTAGVDATLTAVIAVDEGTFAAGAGGVVLRQEGRTWVREATGTGADLRTLAVDAHGVLWTAGNDGALLRREAGGWTAVAVPDIEGGGLCRANLTSLAVLGDTLVVASDAGEVLAHADGGWRRLGSFAPYGVIQLAAAATGELFASTGDLHCYAQGRWNPVALDQEVRLLAAAGTVLLSSHAYSWVIARFLAAQPDSSNWSVTLDGAPTAICLDAAGRALAVDAGGGIMRRIAGAWQRDPAGRLGTGRLFTLLDGSCVLAAGGRFLVRDEEGRWLALEDDDSAPRLYFSFHLDGVSRSDFYVCIWPWQVSHYDGSWTELPLPSPAPPILPIDWDPEDSFLVDGEGVPWLCGDFHTSVEDGTAGTGRDIWRWVRGAWSRASTPRGERGWNLQRTASGQVFAHGAWGAAYWQRDGWRGVPGIAPDKNGRLWLAGRAPGPLVALRGADWLARLSPWDTTAAWEALGFTPFLYDPRAVEGRGGIYLQPQDMHGVQRLGADERGEWAWTYATGVEPEAMYSLHVEREGSLIAVGYESGRVYRYRPPAAPFNRTP